MTHHELGQKEALAVSRAKQENISVGEAFGADPVIMAATEHCGAARKD
ncbi:MAG TPA: hypothetical protein VGR62_06170 [Candidatus Binatia bacterium]|nr:hypothetical protein [Candidatus Binatia bacterium]